MFSRLPYLLPPSIADRLLAGAYGCKIELLKFSDDDGESQTSISVRLDSELTGATAPTAVAELLLAFLRSERGESEAGHE
jgi:hypothetical protein